MTVYMPTILMNIVGHSTMYFKPFFFEAQVFHQLIFAFISLFLFLCLLSQGLCQSNRNACADNNVCEVSLMTINIKMKECVYFYCELILQHKQRPSADKLPEDGGHLAHL